MRIARLDLLAFGPFTDLCLDLDQGEYGLHLIYGPNEAGKSSALRALRQFFYGIEPRTADNFVHNYASLRVGAVLRDDLGREQHFIRRKGNKDTLRGDDDRQVVDPGLLSQLLGGVDEQDFRRRFGIDRQELVRGGEDIVRGGGGLGGILFAAGAGLSGLNAIQARLEEDAERLFKPQGSLPQINKTLKDLQDARRLRKESMLRPAIWTQHKQALDEAQSEHQEIAALLLTKRGELQRLERIRHAVPLIDKRRHLLEQLRELGDVPLLTEDFAEQRRDAAGELTRAQSSWKQAGEALADIETALAGLDISEPLLKRAPAIQCLRDPLGAIRKAARDRPALLAQRDHLQQEARTMLVDLGRSEDLDEVQRLELDRSRRQRIKRLAKQRDALADRCQAARQRYETLQRDRREKDAQLQELPPAQDTADLRRLLKRAAGEGDLEERQKSLQQQLGQGQQQTELCLARLGLWSGSLEDLERLAVPSRETIDRVEAQLHKDQMLVEACEQRRQELQAAIARRSAEIEELRQRQDAVTEEDLQTARQQRDAGWQLVLAAWQGPPPDELAVAAFVASQSPAEDLAGAYRVGVERADGAADRMRREADQVARKAHLLCELQGSRAEHQEILLRQEAAADQLAGTRRQWHELWTPLGIDPLPPREMLAWISRHCDLLRSLEEIRNLREESTQLDRRIENGRQELLQLLDASAADTRPELTLAELREQAEEVADRREKLRAQRAQLERDLELLTRQLPEACQEVQQADDQLTAWQEEWSEAMSWLDLAADVSPDEALDFTEAVQDLLAKWKKSDELSRRIAEIDRDAESFACQVRALGELTGDLEQPAELAADGLLQQLADCQAAKARREELDEQRRREQARQRDAAARIDEMANRLAGLCREAGCQSPDQLPELERRSTQRRQAELELKRTEDRILELAAGTPLEQFVQDAAAHEADQLQPMIAQLDEALGGYQQRKEALADTITRQQLALEGMDGSSIAAAADEQAQGLLAQIRADAEEYVRLRLASAILQQAIERYRENNQDPVLQRASRLFGELTVGSYCGLREDYDERGAPILVGVRDNGRAVVTLDGMSDGCRDQLYLALRLASLEHFLSRNPPLPFIVDDVLVQFDDQRAAAALRVLSDLSRQTQVLFFTHHEHLVSLAEQHAVAGTLFVHRLRAGG